MTRTMLRGATLTAALLLLPACADEEMAPYGRLTSLRVLAIQSDPVAPGPGETTTLTPLLYVPEGQLAPEFEWSWCPFPGPASDGYPCEVEPGELGELSALAELGIPLELPPLELGSGPTATFTHGIAPELLQMLCAELGPDLPEVNCPLGFPVQLRLRASNAEAEVFAVRPLYLAFTPGQVNASIPVIPGLELRRDGEWRAVTEGFADPLRRDDVNALRTSIEETAAETYTVVVAAGETAEQRERLTLSWFVESGDTKSFRTGFIDGVSGIGVLNENEWYPARVDDDPRETAELVLVLRDNREGVSWWRHTFALEEAE